MSLGQTVWDELEERYGSDLRVVIRYHPSEFETCMREDIRGQYTEAEVREIVDDAIIEQLSLDRKEQAIKTGDLHGVVQIFDTAWVLFWPDTLHTKSGFIVSLQRAQSSIEMDSIDDVDRFLNEEISPSIS
ncbi:hypothetical protein CP556_10375 [Natrinema sp. CBA1119]|uniref:hypothetical protein n=1 Tax=Natrinema sp. CBA1119 TaxID=1608465 RepID=UPI000BF2779F|nr:hypothetical protein [Natrinema sp. CBA1119]PGF16483.1 hypothetical protein CP556_10375 [Natrinema sp. CBA1119]